MSRGKSYHWSPFWLWLFSPAHFQVCHCWNENRWWLLTKLKLYFRRTGSTPLQYHALLLQKPNETRHVDKFIKVLNPWPYFQEKFISTERKQGRICFLLISGCICSKGEVRANEYRGWSGRGSSGCHHEHPLPLLCTQHLSGLEYHRRGRTGEQNNRE